MSLHEASAAPRPETQWEGGPAHASWILATAGPKGQTRGVKGAWCRPGVQGVRMAETAELMSLRRAIDDVRGCVAVLRDHHGDIPSVRRLVGDVERLDLDAADLDLPPLQAGPEVVPLGSEPVDPTIWMDADDEGVGGYHGGWNQ